MSSMKSSDSVAGAHDRDHDRLDTRDDNQTGDSGMAKQLPGVIVAENAEVGYAIVNKPAGVPVHSTVDNILENVAAAVGRSLLQRKKLEIAPEEVDGIQEASTTYQATAGSSKSHSKQRGARKKPEPLVYVTTPQRLDQNTSGLFVLSTKKSFAAYFAKLLRNKTDKQLSAESETDNRRSLSKLESKVHKTYRCLVCISPRTDGDVDGSPRSMDDFMERLRAFASNSTILRHYLEPSIRAPKKFAATAGNSSWAECLLRIAHVGTPYPIIGSEPSKYLGRSLWSVEERIPSKCVAVVELEIELLTGRTHQIRGQLSVEGFPLVGDAQYGGAIPLGSENGSAPPTHNIDSERLALQCCQLEFLDPDFVVKVDGTVGAVPSNRWNTFRLDTAWWTPSLSEYEKQLSQLSPMGVTTSLKDQENVRRLKEQSKTVEFTSTKPSQSSAGLPPRTSISPGLNKYVLVKASRPGTKPIWFVKSASPSECGGPYHADVAEELVEQLVSAGYQAQVMGGGRIEFDEKVPHAHVFGFSYGFGKGDHKKAASIIEESSKEIIATFDNSDGLY